MAFICDKHYVEFGSNVCDLCRAEARAALVEELVDWLKKEFAQQNCVCKLNPFVGGPVPCETCQLGKLIAKASHIRTEVPDVKP